MRNMSREWRRRRAGRKGKAVDQQCLSIRLPLRAKELGDPVKDSKRS